MKAQLKKKEDRLKRIHKYHEKKKDRDTKKKEFLEEIQSNARIAEMVKYGGGCGNPFLSGSNEFSIQQPNSRRPIEKNKIQSNPKMKTLSDLGGNDDSENNQMLRFQEMFHSQQQSSGFQVIAPTGKSLKPQQESDPSSNSMMYMNPINPLPRSNRDLLQEALSFQNLTANLPNLKSKGGKKHDDTKELEMMYDKVMNPEKYKRKYGHLEKQKLMPPSYLQKRQRKSRKDKDEVEEIEVPSLLH